MKNTYQFTGEECEIGRGETYRIMRPGDTIELTEEEYQDAKEGGVALEPAD